MPRGLKILLKTLLGLIVFVAVVLGVYLLYLQAHYERIPDEQIVRIEGNSPDESAVRANTPYTVMTYDIGFGAHTPDFTFFLAEGKMLDGTATKGTHGKATGEASVRTATESIIQLASSIVVPPAPEPVEQEWWMEEQLPAPAAPDPVPADFMLFQQVDIDSDRSYHLDQKTMIKGAFPSYSAYYAEDFHTGFVVLPPTDMLGRATSGLLTLTSIHPSSVIRRSYPIDESIPARYVELDRCLCVVHIPVSDAPGDLVIINHHLSPKDKDGEMRAQQLSLLSAILTSERSQGNYVIVGGNWNHALADSSELYPTQQQVPDWGQPLANEALPQGYVTVRADNIEAVATCRGADLAYDPGVSYVTTVDGFVVSDNVRAHATNVDTGFAYSNHNPVLLSFELAS